MENEVIVNEEGVDWLQRESFMAYVSTAEEGIVWALDEEGEVWILDSGTISIDDTVPNDQLGWTHAPDALLMQVDVGYNSQVAGVDSAGKVYWRTGVTDGNFGGDGWTTLADSPAMVHVTVCDTGVFWGNTADHKVYYRSGVNDDTPMGNAWVEVTSDMHNLRQISCGYRGYVVGRNDANKIIMRREQTATNPAGNLWAEIQDDQEFRYVSIGIDGKIWAVRSDGVPMMRVEVNDEQPMGTGWMEVSNSAQMRFTVMEVGDCQIFATDDNYHIWRRRGCQQATDSQAAVPMGVEWEQEPGMLMHISVGYGPMLWGVDPWNDAWYKIVGEPNGKTERPPSAGSLFHQKR
jgi:hypothetical protein